MKEENNTTLVADPVAEARRYVENAKTILREKADLDPSTQFYGDRKYVRMAGNTLWNGVLLILDAVFHVKKEIKGRPSIDDYQKAIVKRDKKLLDYVDSGYNIMHLGMGYDGVLKKSICQEGINIANDIIERCSRMLT